MFDIQALVIFVVVGVGLVAFKRYFSGARCWVTRDLTGKVAVITGGNTGIGYETAKKLSQLGCKVIFGARDQQKNKEALQKISKTSLTIPSWYQLDLSDRESIQNFAQSVKNEIKDKQIDFLINNAAVIAIADRKQTKMGLEMQIGVNHFGHFYLTYLLWGLICKSCASRVINVSSVASEFSNSELDFQNLQFQNGGYSAFKAYSRSKTANIMFTKQLQRRSDSTNKNCLVLCLHPGTVRTQATREIINSPLRNFIFYLINPIFWFFSKSAEEGAQTTLYTVLERQDKLEKGSYYQECKKRIVKYEKTADPQKERLLWQISEKVFGIEFNV